MPQLSAGDITASNASSNFKILGLDQDGNVVKIEFDPTTLKAKPNYCVEPDPATGNLTTSWRSVAGQPAILHAGFNNCPPFVGIGTEFPTTNLDVNGNARIGKLHLGGANTNDLENNPNTMIVNGRSTFNLTHAEAFVINQNANTGYQFLMSLNANNANAKIIGVQNGPTTNAVNTFNLYADGRMELGQTNTNAGILLKVNGGVVFGNESDPANIFTIYGNGKVGIGGVPGTDTKLAVEGLISARLLKLRPPGIAFPDYVFEKKYQLLPLAEIEKYIKRNKHLPGIPTAREVETNNGFEVGALQLKSLEKIEELYLHIIALEKRIKELEAKN